MLPLPEWAPGVHPLIVHFPIAILFIAALADLLALILKRHVWLRWAASALYALGAASALIAFFTGRSAADSVFPSAAAGVALTDHADWATLTVWFYGLYALGRLAVEWRRFGDLTLAHVALFVLGAGGLLLVKETGEHGAQMVYRYGLGVRVAEAQISQIKEETEDHSGAEHAHAMAGEHHHDAPESAEGEEHMHGEGEAHGDADMHGGEDADAAAGTPHHDGSERMEGEEHMHGDKRAALDMPGHVHPEGEGHARDGSAQAGQSIRGWVWKADRDGVSAFKRRFQIVEGDWVDVRVAVDRDDAGNDVLDLQANGTPILFVSEPPIGSLQYDLRLNLDGFKGTVRLAHHVHDAQNYNFMEIDDTEVALGRVVNGQVRIEDRGSISHAGWFAMRAVSDGTHFRGYVGTKLAVHGHGTEPTPGQVGLYIDGTGLLMVNDFEVQVLR